MRLLLALPLILLALALAPAPASAARAWSDPVTLEAGAPSVPGGEATMVSNDRGDAVTVWRDGASLLTAFRPAGGTFGAPVRLADAEAVASIDVALNADGVLVAAWLELGRWVKVATRVREEAPTAALMLSRDGLYAHEPQVAIDAAGRAIVAFNEQGRIVAAVHSVAERWTRATGLGDGARERFALSSRPDGRILLAWRRATTTALGPVAVADGSTSGAFGPPVDVAPDRREYAMPVAALGPDGTAAVAWESDAGHLVVARREPGGAFGAPQTVACRAAPRALALSADGTASVTFWQWLVDFKVGQSAIAFDAPAAQPRSADCIPRPHGPGYDPVQPVAGVFNVIRVPGTDPAFRPGTTWDWDMNGDGDYEISSGTDPWLRHMWQEPGQHAWGLRVSYLREDGSPGVREYRYGVQVAPGATILPSGRQSLRAVTRDGLRVWVAGRPGPVVVRLRGRGLTLTERQVTLAGTGQEVRLVLTREARAALDDRSKAVVVVTLRFAGRLLGRRVLTLR